MDENLLSYYNRELAYLRSQGADFAEKHPKIAGRLRVDRDVVEDPHVSRLIEAFAFLTARLRYKLDDEYPELTQALMGTLFPDYHAPVPSMSIVAFAPVPDRAEPHEVPAGTLLYSDDNPDGTCYFSTCYDTEALPMTVEDARFNAQPFEAPPQPRRDGAETAQGLLRLTLAPLGSTTLPEIGPRRLRLYINGQPQLACRMYEYLLRHAIGVRLAEHARDPNALALGPDCLRPVGLAETERVLPMDGRGSPAHRLLAEYFAFPQKFLFVDLLLPDGAWDHLSERAQVYIYFDETHPELVQGVGPDALILGATPVINLFRHTTEALSAGEAGYEIPLRVDATNTACADVHTLLGVYAVDAEGEQCQLQPFYGAERAAVGDTVPGVFWHARRELSTWYNGRPSRGLDTQLSFVDREGRMTNPDSDWLVYAEALCTNRDIPDNLPFGPDRPSLHFLDGGAGLTTRCICPPTRTILPSLADATRWQLVTHLSLQQFGGRDGLEVLKQTLRLYDFGQTRENAAVINGLADLRLAPATARISRQGRAGLCQGTRIHLELDEARYSGAGVFLFSAILSEFFAQYCALNTFTQLIVRSRQRPESEIVWPPRNGKQTLL